MMLIARTLFSFETFFVLFLLSYQFKNALVFQNWPDLTLLLFGGALLAFGLQKLLGEKTLDIEIQKKANTTFFTPETIVVLLFLILAWNSRFWSVTPGVMTSKLLLLTLYTIPAYLFAEHFLASDALRLKRLYKILSLFSVFITLFVIQVLFLSPSPDLNNILGNNYLIAGQTLGLGTLIFFANTLYHRKKITITNINLLMAAGLFALLLILPGRGPVLSALTAMISLTILSGLKKERRTEACLSFLFVFVAALLFYLVYAFMHSGPLDTSLTRSQDFLLPVIQDRSLLDRFDYYHSAITLFLKNPLSGVGFGDWAAASGIDTPFAPHPHNLFLEIASELGLFGLLLVSILGALIFEHIRRLFFHLSSDFMLLTTLGLFIFACMNAFKSGDLNDNIVLWFSAGTFISLARQKRKYS